jgi:hypothetical protein
MLQMPQYSTFWLLVTVFWIEEQVVTFVTRRRFGFVEAASLHHKREKDCFLLRLL